MNDRRKNSLFAKTKRTLTSILPISQRREGECVNCGECCKLLNICPFLKYESDKKSYCAVYKIRPLNCRKYPRTASEFITLDTCGYKFKV